MGLYLEKELTADTIKMSVFVDPVFKKEIDVRAAKYVAGYGGKTYYFCSVCSKKLFMEHPERYVKD